MDEKDDDIIWDSSQPTTSAVVEEGEHDPLLSSLPSERVEEFLCTSPSRAIPSMTASDVAQNLSSQSVLFGDLELDFDQNQIVLEDEEFLFDLPEEGSTSSVQLANALIDRITADDQDNREYYENITPLRAMSDRFSADTSVTGSAESASDFNKSGPSIASSNNTPNRYRCQTPGIYDLTITVEAAGKRKMSDYVYDAEEETLFARPFVYVPFIVRYSKMPPAGSILRIYARYARGEHSAIPVRRCPHHLASDDSNIREHFIVSDTASAVYVNASDTSDRNSLCISIPQSDEPLYIRLQFMCFSSCNGGINRRPLNICFALEINGESVGHRELSLKVCACPARDATVEGFEPPSKRRRIVITKPLNEVVTRTHCVNSEKKKSLKEDEDTIYEVQIRGRHLYKLVCSIIASYELSRRYLKEKESTDKLDTLKSPTTPLSHRTAIPTWLANLDLSKYEDLFSAKSLFVIDDLEGVINKKVYFLNIFNGIFE
uniref:P53 DNA-binding domain-containing protein n=1 Tax=Ascaris lumbricoides TaxID=6252 RepID=A0A9J2Q9R2_ASCLU